MKIYNFNDKANNCGKQVKKARTMLGINQSELAARLQVANVDIEQKAISRIEKGERFVADYELLALSKVLNVSIEKLLSD